MKIAATLLADQAFGFLVGLGLVALVQPTTSGGTLLLILIGIAAVNVIAQIIRLLFRSAKKTGQTKGDSSSQTDFASATPTKFFTAVSEGWSDARRAPFASNTKPGEDRPRERSELPPRHKIFISYRRDDSAGNAGRIHDSLEHAFGQDLLFMDVDSIALGRNFVDALKEEIAKCDVLLAVIGSNWLDARDEKGQRRLDNPNDFVRVEIATALQRRIPVVPILL